VEILQECQLGQGLTGEQCHRIASISREESYEAGQFIFKEGDQARSFYLLVEGEVVLAMRMPPLREQDRRVWGIFNVITKGEIFGWSAAVKPHVYTTSARATAKCDCIAMDNSELLKLMDSDPVLGCNLLRGLLEIIAHRLVRTRLTLLDERGLAIPDEEQRL